MSNKIFITFFLVLFFSACMNSYERKIIGRYSTSDYSLNDSAHYLNHTDLPYLILNGNKKFTLVFRSNSVEGTWSADDYGDFTLVDFEVNNNKQEGILLGPNLEIIKIDNPSVFYFPSLKSISFKRK